MNNLTQSLFILDHFAWLTMRKTEILYTKSVYMTTVEHKVFDDDNYHMLAQSSILNTCSFLEEYHKQFGVKTEPLYQDKIFLIKKICSPFVKEISKWSDLHNYRNVIAHTLRDRNGKFSFLDPDHDVKYNTPNNAYDWLLLRNCMIEIKNILNSEFGVELEEGKKELLKIEYTPKPQSILSQESLVKKFFSIHDESKKIALENGKSYNYNITDFYNSNKPALNKGMMDSY